MANFSGSIPSASSIFSAYASLSASIMLVKTAVNQIVPAPVQNYISTTVKYYFKSKSADITVVIEESDGMSGNELYAAAETYLYSKIDSSIERLKISKRPKQARLSIKFAQCGKMVDFYEGVEVVWRFGCEEKKRGSKLSDDDDSGNVYSPHEKRYFEISFNKKYKEMILDSYIPYVLKKSKEIKSGKKVLKLHTLASYPYSSSVSWESINLEHPSTFQTIAMDTELKKAIIDDLDRFVRRKDFYRKVGKAWKRGYLLYGPPGTGKSSLIAAMANHLKFDIYDLELAGIKRDSDLRRLLLRTANRSILVIEDIDCTVDLPNREDKENSGQQKEERHQFTLSGLLNFIDGLWSSCGDERIIIFTTNNKDKLDPALLRPGRMDMHIPMLYLTTDGFRTLATNYLNMESPHWRFREIEGLIGSMNVTPAEVAEELMRSEDPDVSLRDLSKFLNLKRKKMEEDEVNNGADVGSKEEECNGIDDQTPKGKRIKLDNGHDEHLTPCNGV
ncbi:OLC1v1010918C1 [Oldenlandia corymbosa var. corymbosa]|uniref:OLC1v1010918C1 n=1 Tax=Oldenlandia corymbosa var. corymbosa TaxID=529605 RepID=A0AAV1DSM7_OLDCO|nr:OLC1v1010918C1 [Oldenlandia corymbosa var. corymbosa]